MKPTAGCARNWGAGGWPSLVVVSLLLSGCATTEPIETPTAGVEIPASWTAPGNPAGLVPDERWWRSFGDAGLDAVIRRALVSNHDLAIAAARIEQALAQARIARGGRRPQLEAAAGASRERQNLIGLPFAGGGAFVTDARSVALNASWEVDLWNRLGAEARAAALDARAARADFAAARLSLAGQAAKAYFGLVEAERQVEVARRTLETRQATTARVRRRYEAGLVAPLDLRLALTSEAAAAGFVAARERALDAARRELEALLGSYPEGTLDGAERLPVAPETPAAGVPAALLMRRPDLAAAELRIAAAGGRVEAARAALYPQLRLTASIGRRAGELGNLTDPAFSVWSLAANLLAPIYAGGTLRARVELARAILAEALARYRQAVLDAFLEVERALAADRHLAEQVAASSRQLEQAEAAARLADERYAAGLADLLTVLEAERQRLDAASQLLAARRERLQARIDLYLALGGGFDAR